MLIHNVNFKRFYGLTIVGLLFFSLFLAVSIVRVKASPLSVVSVTPADNSTNIPPKTYPVIVFSEPVNPATLTGSVNGMPIVPVQVVFDSSDQTLKIDFGEMEYEKKYSVVISGNLEDTVGNKMGDDYAFSFTTATMVSKRPTSTISVPTDLEPGKTYTITGKATGYTWQRDPDNPLKLIHWDQSGNVVGDRPMLHPTVLYFPAGMDGYKFYLVYTPYPDSSDENPCLMRSNDGKAFTDVGVTNPLFTYGTQPVYDSQNLADPDSIKVGNAWMIFYEMEQAEYGHLGVAFSTDGIHYTAYGGPYDQRPLLPWPTDGNPVIHFSNDTWYEHDDDPTDSAPRLGEPAVVFKDNTFHIWYSSYNIGRSSAAVYANSSDPRGPWTKLGPVLDPVGHPDVVYDPERNLYVMWYLSQTDGQNNIATAPEPWGPWTNHPDNPIFTAQGGWEGSSLYRSALVEVGTQWYLYYSANPGSDGMIGLAKEVPGIRKAEISTDGGSSWTQLTVSPDGSWSYLWTPLSKQIYSIQVRVTDDWMVGEPSEAIANVGWSTQPANPILVVVNSTTGSFGQYTGEILKAEGLNEFQMTDMSQVTASFLASFDTVILTTMSLSTQEATMYQNYVDAGGNLIAFKPDSKLAPIFGLTPTGTTTSEGYIKVDNTTDIGKGIVADTIQFHGTADNYNLNGASVIATLYSGSSTPTGYPAVACYNVGYGRTVFFAYDLPKCIVYLRQGNPENANKELDGLAGLRPSDLFVGWLDVRKVPIPQADEQMRLLSNAIMRLNYYKEPLPRLWYFPNFEKTMFIMTGDSDGSSSDQVYQELAEIEARGGRFSFYMTDWMSPTDVQNWTARGVDVGWHPYPSGDYAAWYDTYTSIINQFQSTYGFSPTTGRNHCIVWFNYVDVPKIEAAHGIRMDLNYAHCGLFLDPGDGWRNGWMTGSGIPMKFADENGTVIDCYQSNFSFLDELWMNSGSTGAEAATVAASFFNMSEDGFYSAFAGNFHPVSWSGDRQLYGEKLMDYAVSYGVPIWNAKQMLDFTDAKNKATFDDITYSAGELRFILNLPVEVDNLTVMVPFEHEGRTLNSIALNSNPQTFKTDTINGIKYALFLVSSVGNSEVTASYGADTTPPEITIVSPTNGTVLPADTTSLTITITTNEYSDCRYSTTNPLFDYSTEGTDFTLGQGTLRHSFTLSPVGMGQTYNFYYKAKDSAGNINAESTSHTFSIALVDKTPPEWRKQGENKSLLMPGDSALLYAQGKDDYGLHCAVLATNETGTWKNLTWWDTSWPYRKPITLTENSGSTLTDYQVRLNIVCSSKMKSDFSDLRFTAQDEMTPIPYWIESYTASAFAFVWVKVPTIPASGTTTIYMYYGNPSATDASDGAATMEFCDNFSGSTLDTSKWTVNAVNQISYTVNNYFRFEEATHGNAAYWVYDGTDTGSQHQANWTPPSQFIVEFKSKINSITAAEMGEGCIGLVAADSTVIGMAGYCDPDASMINPWSYVVTENLASSLGPGVAITGYSANSAFKTATSDVITWKIMYDGSTLKFYENGEFFDQASVSSPVSKLALVAGTYYTYPYLNYIQMNTLTVRKYASSDPTSIIGQEEAYGLGGTIGPWWDNSWPYRKPITLTENSGSTLTDYQVMLNVAYVPSRMKSDFSDLRFTTSDPVTPTSLSYWIESYTASASAVIWVKVPTIPASGTTTIYMYYGNPSATYAGNGDTTFEFFDDFNDGIIDTSKWITSGIVTETGGYLQVGSGTDSIAMQNTANYPLFSGTYALRHRGLVSQAGGGYAYMGLADSGITRCALSPHTSSGYTTYDGITQQFTNDFTGFTSYADYDIILTGSNVKYYQDGVLKGTHTNPPSVPMGAYIRAYTADVYARCDWILIRKSAQAEPSSSIDNEETYSPQVMHYYHGSPQNMGDTAEIWAWSNFTWNNPTLSAGTTVAWRIWYEDASGNWNSTDVMTFSIVGAMVEMHPGTLGCRKSSESFTVPIKVTNTSSEITNFAFEIHYDTTLLDYADVTWNAWGSGTITVDEAGGKVTGITSGTAISGTQTLVTIQFTAAYNHIWKDESKVPGWKNDQNGLIFFQSADLSYAAGGTLHYVRGGAKEINVGSDVTYTFSPIRGDVDNNGVVGIFDLRTVAAGYDKTPSDPEWNSGHVFSTYDLNGDNIIDIFDLVVIASNFGYTYP